MWKKSKNLEGVRKKWERNSPLKVEKELSLEL